jgi:hypothetical protein
MFLRATVRQLVLPALKYSRIVLRHRRSGYLCRLPALSVLASSEYKGHSRRKVSSFNVTKGTIFPYQWLMCEQTL